MRAVDVAAVVGRAHDAANFSNAVAQPQGRRVRVLCAVRFAHRSKQLASEGDPFDVASAALLGQAWEQRRAVLSQPTLVAQPFAVGARTRAARWHCRACCLIAATRDARFTGGVKNIRHFRPFQHETAFFTGGVGGMGLQVPVSTGESQVTWWRFRDLNPGPADYDSVALTS